MADKNMYKFPNEYTQLNFKYDFIQGYISVIIPVYADPQGLEDTLVSLKNQTLKPEEFEIIVANDGGDPKITQVCQKQKVKVVNIIPNQGSYTARNTAIEESHGEFLAFTDADIIVPPHWLETGLKGLRDEGDYVGGPVIIDENKVKNIVDYYEFRTAFNIDKYFNKLHFFPTANLFVRREVFMKLGGFDRRLRSSGDLEMGNRIHNYSCFKQVVLENNSILHPPRGFKALTKKRKRITRGLMDLYDYYPFRFPEYKYDVVSSLQTILFPSGFKRAKNIVNKKYGLFPLFLLSWWFNWVSGLFRIGFILRIIK